VIRKRTEEEQKKMVGDEGKKGKKEEDTYM
jgi:hypothetical protein